MVEKSLQIGIEAKKFYKRTKMLIFNLQMLPFMEYEEANKFYIKFKKFGYF